MDDVVVKNYEMIISDLKKQKADLLNKLDYERKENEILKNKIKVFGKLVAAKDSLLIESSRKKQSRGK